MSLPEGSLSVRSVGFDDALPPEETGCSTLKSGLGSRSREVADEERTHHG